MLSIVIVHWGQVVLYKDDDHSAVPGIRWTIGEKLSGTIVVRLCDYRPML